MLITCRLTLCAALAVLLTGCRAQPVSTPPHSSSVPTQVGTPTPRVASGGPAFDGARAFRTLQAQCALGPRKPGTLAHERGKALILSELTPYVDKVVTQRWSFHDDARHVTLPLTNIVGIINPGASKKVMLFTHWDTRPTADQELEAANKSKPILGADDGASGTAVLLELARALHKQKPNVCVELLFVDGEDWGPGEDKMYLGAIHFAEHPGVYKPDYAILLDMIGAKDLLIYREKTSQQLHPELNDKVWAAASSLGYANQFPDAPKWQISDDHDTFNAHGIPAIDLIDFDYAFWHTLADTPDKCSPQSLQAVGDVMEKVIYDER